MTEQLVRPETDLRLTGALTPQDLGTGPLPYERYHRQEWFEVEREKVFKRSWLCLGRVEEIPEINDYLVKTIEIAKVSVIVARGSDGVVRAFHNVCSHRASMIFRGDGCGNAKAFVCPYHAWNYTTNGELRAIPLQKEFYDVDKSTLGLTPIHCEIWEGFIFVNLDPNPRETLEQHLGELYGLYSGYFDGLAPINGHSAVVGCNWKTLLDAFVETYHFSSIHTKTVPAMTGEVIGSRLYEKHRVMTTTVSPPTSPSIAELLAFKYGQGLSGTEVKPLPPGINVQQHPAWHSDITIVFPNFDVHIIGDWVLALWFWPLDRNTTRFVARYYMRPPRTCGEALTQGYTSSRLRDVFREDLYNIEFVQQGMESGAKRQMVLQGAEVAIRHAHAVLENYVRDSA